MSGLLYFALIAKALRKQFLATMLSTFVISYTVAKVASHFFYNTRPFVLSHTLPLIQHAADNGFPSDHVLLSASIASVIFVFNKKFGCILFLLTLLVGYSRVVIGLHHALDIFGSIFIAAVATYISNEFIKYLVIKNKKLLQG